MAGNLSIILAATLQTTDTTLSPSPQIITRSLNNPTVTPNVEYYNPFFSASTGGSAVTLPVATCPFFYVKNLDTTSQVEITYQGTNQATNAIVTLDPGGVLIILNPPGVAGITSATIKSLGASAVRCDVQAAG